MVLTVDIPEERITRYEWIEEGKPYREFLAPAAVVNRFGLPTIHEEGSEPSEDPAEDERKKGGA